MNSESFFCCVVSGLSLAFSFASEERKRTTTLEESVPFFSMFLLSRAGRLLGSHGLVRQFTRVVARGLETPRRSSPVWTSRRPRERSGPSTERLVRTKRKRARDHRERRRRRRRAEST